MFFCHFRKVFKNTFFTELLRVTACDIQMQVVPIYDLNLSLQFVAINFTFSLLWVSTLALALMLPDFLFYDGRVIFSQGLQDHL